MAAASEGSFWAVAMTSGQVNSFAGAFPVAYSLDAMNIIDINTVPAITVTLRVIYRLL
jgi:hypothetical protein